MARELEAAYVLEAVKAWQKSEADLEKKSQAEFKGGDFANTTQKRRAALRQATATAAEERDRCQHEVMVRLTEVGLLTNTELEKEATARHFGCDWKLSRRQPDPERLNAWKEKRA